MRLLTRRAFSVFRQDLYISGCKSQMVALDILAIVKNFLDHNLDRHGVLQRRKFTRKFETRKHLKVLACEDSKVRRGGSSLCPVAVSRGARGRRVHPLNGQTP